MFAPRVIPVLTLIEDGLYRTRRFKKPAYVGDPLNAVRIFNDKEVDELLVVDITPERGWSDARLRLLGEMAQEAFMPMALGGNITEAAHVERAFEIGYDKVIVNSAAVTDMELIERLAGRFGGQSIVVSMDVAKRTFGRRSVFSNLGRNATRLDPIDYAKHAENAGAGEIIIRSIEHDGMMEGFDLQLIADVADAVSVPVVAAGGAGSLADLTSALSAGAHSVAVGSMFVYQGPHRAVLINYPTAEEIDAVVSNMGRA